MAPSLTIATRTRNGDNRRTSSGAQSVVAGVIAGCVTRSCTSPLDVLKIIIQVNGGHGGAGGVPRAAVGSSSMTAFRGVAAAATASTAATTSAVAATAFRPMALASQAAPLSASSSSSAIAATVQSLYAHEGARGFWKGNLAGCCRLGPYAGAKFFIFDTLQARFLDAEPSHAQRAVCGAAAGLVATMGTYPMEVVRTRIITQTAATPATLRIHGVLHGLEVILRHEGLRGLYKGGWSGIVGAIPFEGVQFGCYEYLKHSSQANQWPAFRWPAGKTELDGIDYFVCGSIAGAIAQTVAYPFDTVKKRLQIQTARRGAAMTAADANALYYEGMVDCFRKVIRDEGLLALYRGTVPNLARIVPYAAVMFSTYEMSKKTLRLLCETC